MYISCQRLRLGCWVTVSLPRFWVGMHPSRVIFSAINAGWDEFSTRSNKEVQKDTPFLVALTRTWTSVAHLEKSYRPFSRALEIPRGIVGFNHILEANMASLTPSTVSWNELRSYCSWRWVRLKLPPFSVNKEESQELHPIFIPITFVCYVAFNRNQLLWWFYFALYLTCVLVVPRTEQLVVSFLLIATS